jgi:aryl-alcohol dehydrogenase-like predicted oxidoreductase
MSMLERSLGSTEIRLSSIGLGAWSFGSDEIWWGKQRVVDSMEVLGSLLDNGINFIDTAPVYGRGKSETIIGEFFRLSGLRDRFILATKCGLSWKGKEVYHDLKRTTVLREFDESRKRLNTDVIDIYQLHFPDPNTEIAETAETVLELLNSRKIKAVGLSNFALPAIREFTKHCPVHLLQMRYNLFYRDIEDGIIPYCLQQGIGILAYAPLQHGLLTGKYHFAGIRPKGLLRRTDPDLNGERFNIAKETLEKLNRIALKRGWTLSKLCVNWVATRPGITSALTGCRNAEQLKTNVGVMDGNINADELKEIDFILRERIEKIECLERDGKK